MHFAEIPVLTQMPSTVAPGEMVMQTITLLFQTDGVTDVVIAPVPSSPEQSILFYQGREFHTALSVDALTEAFGSGR